MKQDMQSCFIKCDALLKGLTMLLLALGNGSLKNN